MTTRRSPHERGAMQLGRLFMILVGLALVLAVWVGFPAATKGFELRRATVILATRCLNKPTGCDDEISRYMHEAHVRHGITIQRGDVTVLGEPSSSAVRIEVHVMLPFEIPLINRTIYRRTTIKGAAERSEIL